MTAILVPKVSRIRALLTLVIVLFALGVSVRAEAATLSISPGTGVYTAGQTFTVRVLVNTAGANINAAEGTLSFKPEELAVVSVAKGSIFNLWTADPSFSNTSGTVTFSGGTPTGYTGGAGTVLSVTFRTKGAGSPRVSFQNGSVLAADGRGTNVLTNMSGASFTVSAVSTEPEPERIIEYVPPANTPAAPVITSDTHGDVDRWYKEKTAVLKWDLPSGITAVRTLLDDRASSVPSRVYDTPISTITLENLDEGINYFHLQFQNEDGWGRVAHYRLAIDSEAPSQFDLELQPNADLSNPEQTLVARVVDSTSPVTRYLVQINGADPIELIDDTASGTLRLPKLSPGYHTVVVEAFDAAGNSIMDSLSFTILAFDRPVFDPVPPTVSAGVIPVFSGSTRPNATVAVTLTRIGYEPITATVTSDETGRFRYIPDAKLTEGVYELTARATDSFGAESDISEALRFTVALPGYLQFGVFALSILSVFVPLIALLILTVLLGSYFYRRFRTLRTGVVREAHEAVLILDREFTQLQGLITAEADKLRGARKTGKLTKAEDEMFTSLSEALISARKTIAKEVADVEDIVE